MSFTHEDPGWLHNEPESVLPDGEEIGQEDLACSCWLCQAANLMDEVDLDFETPGPFSPDPEEPPDYDADDDGRDGIAAD